MSYKTDFMLDAFSARIAALEDEVCRLQDQHRRLASASDSDGADIEDLKEAVATMRGTKELPDVTRTYNELNPAFKDTVWADYPQR